MHSVSQVMWCVSVYMQYAMPLLPRLPLAGAVASIFILAPTVLLLCSYCAPILCNVMIHNLDVFEVQ